MGHFHHKFAICVLHFLFLFIFFLFFDDLVFHYKEMNKGSVFWFRCPWLLRAGSRILSYTIRAKIRKLNREIPKNCETFRRFPKFIEKTTRNVQNFTKIPKNCKKSSQEFQKDFRKKSRKIPKKLKRLQTISNPWLRPQSRSMISCGILHWDLKMKNWRVCIRKGAAFLAQLPRVFMC